MVNLSAFEPSSSYRCMNEFFKIILRPCLDTIFRCRLDGKLKKNLVFIVDNGPAEAPASILVQMLLIRMRKFLNLNSAFQVSFAEYHSKRNFVGRVYSKENEVLSRHGPFSSTLVHKKVAPLSKEHNDNMEAMATEVVSCLSEASYGNHSLTSVRGVKDDEYVFNDEKFMRELLSLSEGKKETYSRSCKPDDNALCQELNAVWGINRNFTSSYYDDYKELLNLNKTWKDKYTFINVKETIDLFYPSQPIPDYLRCD